MSKNKDDSLRDWHRYFGLIWYDMLLGTDFEVVLELDLSLKKQLLDVVVIRKGSGPTPPDLPDGFENLADHNLISFKSHQEAFDSWALLELFGHYVNYRKQESPTMKDLLPESQFRLFAVSARHPSQLASQVNLTAVRPGVFDYHAGVIDVRVIVLRDLPEAQQNAAMSVQCAGQQDRIRKKSLHPTFGANQFCDQCTVGRLQNGGSQHAIHNGRFCPRQDPAQNRCGSAKATCREIIGSGTRVPTKTETRVPTKIGTRIPTKIEGDQTKHTTRNAGK